MVALLPASASNGNGGAPSSLDDITRKPPPKRHPFVGFLIRFTAFCVHAILLFLEDSLALFWQLLRDWIVLCMLFGCIYLSYHMRWFFLTDEHLLGEGISDVGNFAQDEINKGIKAVDKGGSDFVKIATFGKESHAISIPTVNFMGRIAGFVYNLINKKRICDASASFSDVIFILPRLVLSDGFCPIVRYNYPFKIFYYPLYILFYVVIFDPTPTPGCKPPAYLYECAFANIYMILTVILVLRLLTHVYKSEKSFLRFVFIENMWKPIVAFLEEVYESLHDYVRRVHDRFELAPPPSS